jgi:hypothetical protein
MGQGVTGEGEVTQSGLLPLISVPCLLSQMTHPIRLLLEYTDSSYEEKRYTMGDGNDTSWSDSCSAAAIGAQPLMSGHLLSSSSGLLQLDPQPTPS